MDAVTQILIDRSRDAQKIGRMVLVSLVAHVGLIAAVTYLPSHWLQPRHDNAAVMTISLGGGPEGPLQGRNQISAKAIQEAVPNAAKPKVEAPPALAKPEMVEPLKNARPQPKAPAQTDTAKTQPQLHGRTPTTGPQVKQGAARIETHGAAVPFGGFATGGTGGAGAAYTDVQNFCCPEYLITMTQLIQKNWRQNQGQAGSVVLKFTILRDGSIADVQVEQPGAQFLNMESQRAIERTRQLPPLPVQFTGDHLTVHLVFQYR